ncbi:MAG TPA: 6-pyruvoyl tetrahydropterin synthase family protein [Planctomycetota bacterium]|jgi:6-pyruvoyltetrahydropterin/6-carboxytetrahydropterin synthase|nr:6-pyruvoyl tetrahydropterin synthase family protein [Planctomycetota bacterium]
MTSDEKYKVRVTKDYLTFCSAHFISFEGTQCERLHGHNYRVAAELEAPLNADYLVFDFIVLKRILRDIANELDHRMLVPTLSKTLQVSARAAEVEIRYREKLWMFPREDCALLPIENSTAELLARWIAGRLLDELAKHARESANPVALPPTVRVEVEESPGQSAVYETRVLL